METVNKKTEITIFKSPPTDVCGIAFLILLFGKVFGYIEFPWWIITAPLWGPFAICFFLFAIFYVIVFAIALTATAMVGIAMLLESIWYGGKKLIGFLKNKIKENK